MNQFISATCIISGTNSVQDSLVREDNLKVEEKSKAMAGTRYENQRRDLDKSLKAKQDTLKAKHRQGGLDKLKHTFCSI